MGVLVDSIVHNLMDLCNNVIIKAMQMFIGMFLENKLTPTFDTFNTMFSSDVQSKIILFFQIIGVALVIMIFLSHLIMISFGNMMEVKDTIGSLVARLLLCVILVTFGSTSLRVVNDNWIPKVFDQLDTKVGNPATDESNKSLSKLLDMGQYKDAIDDAIKSGKIIFSILMPLGSPGKSLLYGIISIVFLAMLFYNIVKLLFELIQRYVMMCALYLGFPSAASFLASADTANVFFSYIRMYLVEVFIILITRFWIYLSLYLMSHMGAGLYNLFILLAFVRIGVQLENLLKSFGLTTANMGGALLDNIVTTAGAMFMAGHLATGAIGKGLIVGGALAGGANSALKMGSVLSGKPIDPVSLSNTARQSIGSTIRDSLTRGTAASNLTNGKFENMKQNIASGAMGLRTATADYASLNAAGKADFTRRMVAASYNNGDNNLIPKLGANGCKFDPQYTNMNTGEIVGDIIGKDKNGVDTVICSAAISSKPATDNALAFTDSTGSVQFLNPTNDKNMGGVTLGFGDNEMNGSSAAELAFGIKAEDVALPDTSIAELTAVGTGGTGCDIYDQDGIIAHKEGNTMSYSGTGYRDCIKSVMQDTDNAGIGEDAILQKSSEMYADQFSDAIKDGQYQHLGYKQVSNVSYDNKSNSFTADAVDIYGQSGKLIASGVTENQAFTQGKEFVSGKTGFGSRSFNFKTNKSLDEDGKSQYYQKQKRETERVNRRNK